MRKLACVLRLNQMKIQKLNARFLPYKRDFNLKGFISFCESSDAIEQVIKTYNDYCPYTSLDLKHL